MAVSVPPRSRAIPPTPRPRGTAFRSRVPRTGAAFAACGSAALRARADYDGGARRCARLTRLLAGRERRCRPRRGPSRRSHEPSPRRSSLRSSPRASGGAHGGGSEERLAAARAAFVRDGCVAGSESPRCGAQCRVARRVWNPSTSASLKIRCNPEYSRLPGLHRAI
jgi:hypothetical protein